MTYLLDTGFLYALLNRTEQQHANVLAASESVNDQIYLPIPVTTEVAYLILRDLGTEALADFTESLAKPGFDLLEPIGSDYKRTADVIRQYHDAHIDFVDAMLVAMAERLKIERILTLDQRHFRLFRPKHCAAFELIP